MIFWGSVWLILIALLFVASAARRGQDGGGRVIFAVCAAFFAVVFVRFLRSNLKVDSSSVLNRGVRRSTKIDRSEITSFGIAEGGTLFPSWCIGITLRSGNQVRVLSTASYSRSKAERLLATLQG